jgi:hypothetical protein
MLGDQHGAIDVLAGRGTREQIGVGRTGLGDDVESAPPCRRDLA